MREIAIKLLTVQDVLDFVALATSRSFSIRVGSPEHQVNAKSFMEMFCLNLREPLTAAFQCSDEDYSKFCMDADRFLVK